jgi:short subunit dehydrogenase-like uncharacterized protein
MNNDKFDVVLYGATSFVGKITARHLLARHGAAGPFRWAIAGRSQAKLEQLRAELGPGAAQLPLIVADSGDEASLRALCLQTRVVCSTVGPYALYGTLLVKACTETGTDYCDLTGEVQWIAEMIPAYEATARKTGARIVHCCGFDSVPSDLGVLLLQQEARRRGGLPCRRVRYRVHVLKGAFSGGTVASLVNVVEQAIRSPELRKLLADPYALCGSPKPSQAQPSVDFVRHEPESKGWIGPFVMAAINTRVVHRSNFLQRGAYGLDFAYDEAMFTGPGLKGWVMGFGLTMTLSFMVGAIAIPPLRCLLRRFVLPQPGEGPSEQQQLHGFYDCRLSGSTAGGQRIQVRVTGDRDPGYGSTGKMLGEAAACLAESAAAPNKAGGFWTPATLMGDRLVARLREHAGMRFEVGT